MRAYPTLLVLIFVAFIGLLWGSSYLLAPNDMQQTTEYVNFIEKRITEFSRQQNDFLEKMEFQISKHQEISIDIFHDFLEQMQKRTTDADPSNQNNEPHLFASMSKAFMVGSSVPNNLILLQTAQQKDSSGCENFGRTFQPGQALPAFTSEYNSPLLFSKSDENYTNQLFSFVRGIISAYCEFHLFSISRHELACNSDGCIHVIEGEVSAGLEPWESTGSQHVFFISEPRVTSEFEIKSSLGHIVSSTDITVNFVITFSSDLASVFIQQQLPVFQALFAEDKNIAIVIGEFNPENNFVAGNLSESGIPFKHESLSGAFSRVKGLNVGKVVPISGKNIVFFLDVDMVFTTRFAQSIRNRCKEGRRIYFPVCFQEDGNGGGALLSEGLGNVGMYRSDFENLPWKKRDDTVWGGEDDALLLLVMHVNYEYYRNAEPGLIHKYHPTRSWRPNITDIQ